MTQKVKEPTQEYDIVVTARHVDISDAMKQHAFDKVSKIDRFHTRIADVQVTMDIQRGQQICLIQMKVNNFRVNSHAATNDMYVSIDRAVQKVQAQIRRYKQRLADHQAKGRVEREMQVSVVEAPEVSDEVEDINDQIEEETWRRLEQEYRPHPVVKDEVRSLKILSTDEAIMKLQLSGDLFLIYRDEQDMKIKVMYLRHDGNYSIVVPE